MITEAFQGGSPGLLLRSTHYTVKAATEQNSLCS